MRLDRSSPPLAVVVWRSTELRAVDSTALSEHYTLYLHRFTQSLLRRLADMFVHQVPITQQSCQSTTTRQLRDCSRVLGQQAYGHLLIRRENSTRPRRQEAHRESRILRCTFIGGINILHWFHLHRTWTRSVFGRTRLVLASDGDEWKLGIVTVR